MIKDDLISRSALLQGVPSSRKATGKTAWDYGVLYMENVIKNTPTVDAVVLPVHVQQIVYANLRPWETTLNVQPFMVTCITMTQNKNGDWKKRFRANWFKDGKPVYESRDFWFDEIGEEVFFTKKEAEAVLGRAKDDR